jgi:glutamate 5-kinase
VARFAGEFVSGDVLSICDSDGTEFARGISNFSAAEMKARESGRAEVIHRDNLVIL